MLGTLFLCAYLNLPIYGRQCIYLLFILFIYSLWKLDRIINKKRMNLWQKPSNQLINSSLLDKEFCFLFTIKEHFGLFLSSLYNLSILHFDFWWIMHNFLLLYQLSTHLFKIIGAFLEALSVPIFDQLQLHFLFSQTLDKLLISQAKSNRQNKI